MQETQEFKETIPGYLDEAPPGINYRLIEAQKVPQARMRVIESEMDRVGIDQLIITDALVDRDNGGQWILRRLEDLQKEGQLGKYRLRVIKHADGSEPKKGDVIRWKTGVSYRNIFGKKITQRQRRKDIRRGLKDKHEFYAETTVDSDLCIEVPFLSALHLLSQWGVHYQSKEPISPYREISSGKHNWLYMEVPPGMAKVKPK